MDAARPDAGSNRARRWLLLIRAVYDRSILLKIAHVQLIALPEWQDDPPAQHKEPIGSIDVITQNTDPAGHLLAEDVEVANGLDNAEIGLYLVRGRWIVNQP